MKTYTEATSETGKKFYSNFNKKGKFVMLNLLKFNEIANYNSSENIKTSGKEAYDLYLKNINPLLKNIGSTILFYGDCKDYLIGPENEQWDKVLLVQHNSIEKFIAFSQSQAYLKQTIHLKASLFDSRLLPINESNTNL